MKAIVTSPVCSLRSAPTHACTLEDEVLCGMVVEILSEAAPGWYRIRTHYRYEGIVSADDLRLEGAEQWEALPKKVIFHKNTCDVLSAPKVQGFCLTSLPRGAVISPVGEMEGGWQKILLPDGREGYVPGAVLDRHHTAPVSSDEETLRKALVDTAMLYAGTHYRWGGKSPLGIDCSGLVSTAYMLCGILIYRDAKIVEGFPIHEIALEDIRPGDLLFFPGHGAMYIGGDRYCHSTGKHGSNGFDINSLNPQHPDYRADLKEKITQVGSYF